MKFKDVDIPWFIKRKLINYDKEFSQELKLRKQLRLHLRLIGTRADELEMTIEQLRGIF